MTFLDKLRAAQRRNGSLLCVGLDPEPSKIPASLRKREDGIEVFCRRIVEATSDLVAAYKLNISFYEASGERSWDSVHRILRSIPPGVVTIGDGKRGDIATSAEKQAVLLCDDWKFDASTVNPYMGRDAVEPFLRRREQGAFVLAVTSNPGGKDFQKLTVKGKPLYEYVIRAAKKWNTLGNVGLVVGATRPAELKRARALAPGLPFLIPGIGAQSGDLAATVRYGCDRKGELAVINVGRAILYASGGEDFAEKARAAALRYRDEINSYRDRFFG